jgi:hypothetical protein
MAELTLCRIEKEDTANISRCKKGVLWALLHCHQPMKQHFTLIFKRYVR